MIEKTYFYYEIVKIYDYKLFVFQSKIIVVNENIKIECDDYSLQIKEGNKFAIYGGPDSSILITFGNQQVGEKYYISLYYDIYGSKIYVDDSCIDRLMEILDEKLKKRKIRNEFAFIKK